MKAIKLLSVLLKNKKNLTIRKRENNIKIMKMKITKFINSNIIRKNNKSDKESIKDESMKQVNLIVIKTTMNINKNNKINNNL